VKVIFLVGGIPYDTLNLRIYIKSSPSIAGTDSPFDFSRNSVKLSFLNGRQIYYYSAQKGEVSISIYGIDGKPVKTLFNGIQQSGTINYPGTKPMQASTRGEWNLFFESFNGGSKL